MVRLSEIFLAAAALLTTAVVADNYTFVANCGVGIGKCSGDTPCCSQYGQCGVGAYCLGGCDPAHSFELGSCVARPQCTSTTYNFPDKSRIISKTEYLGDSSNYDWVEDGQSLVSNNELYLTMAPNSVGTVLASTTYVWYGKITAKIKTSRGRGVVTAFIMMSDVKDEIDYEWVGANLTTTQTNFYWQGVDDYDNSGNISLSDTFENYHTYVVDWQEESITWSIDGQVGRVKNRADTYNATTGNYDFPQTPSRIQLSIWPGGLASNAKGTIDWAGGLIDWNSQDIQTVGYDYAMVSSVTVECYDPPAGTQGNGDVSYEYNNPSLLNNSVLLSNDPHILSSLLATGTNLTVAEPVSLSSTTEITTSTNAAGKPTVVTETVVPTASVQTVPGQVGAGFGTSDTGTSPNDNSDTGSTGSTGSDTSSAVGSTATTGSGGFSQGGSSTTGKSGAVVVQPENAVHGSMLAVVIAIVAMIAL